MLSIVSLSAYPFFPVAFAGLGSHGLFSGFVSPGAYFGIRFTFLQSLILVVLLARIVCGDWLAYCLLDSCCVLCTRFGGFYISLVYLPYVTLVRTNLSGNSILFVLYLCYARDWLWRCLLRHYISLVFCTLSGGNSCPYVTLIRTDLSGNFVLYFVCSLSMLCTCLLMAMSFAPLSTERFPFLLFLFFFLASSKW